MTEISPIESEDEEDGDNLEEMAQYFARHCSGGPGNVIFVTVYLAECDCGSDECEQVDEVTAIFSSFEAAMQWTNSFEEGVDRVFVPFVIDHPDFGLMGEAN